MRFAPLLLFASLSAAAIIDHDAREASVVDEIALHRRANSLPTSFKWSSSDVLISPKVDSYSVLAVKDPSIVQYQGVYHVFTSMVTASGYNLIYLNFTDFSLANSAHQTYLQTTAIGTGYRAAPQIFYFAPQKLWYLIFQDGNAGYSTNANIGNPAGWSAVKNFWSSVPSIITSNIGTGSLVDIWVICDSANCHLFCSDDNGHLYRAQSTLASFPTGMGQPVIAMSDTANKYGLFEASNVYNYGAGYLLLVEAIGSDGHRYFRSWTSTTLAGTWTSLADTEANPFARASNVVFKESPGWTQDISHGEMIRSGYDQTLTIDPCNLRYLYQGDAPGTYSSYNAIPWRLALLTQTNSACSSTTTTTATATTTTTQPSTTTTTQTTTTTSTTSTATQTGTACTQALYGQCGGTGWTGCTVCASGSTCKYSNAYYSQCL